MEATSKQPTEEYHIEADFSRVWMSGDTVSLATSTVTAVNNADEDKTATVLDGSTKAISSSGKGLTIRIRAGIVAESPYKITFMCMTANGQKWELDVQMVIFDE